MSKHANGSFEVKLLPQAPVDNEETSISRMLLDKQFHGDLEASSKGQMLAFMAPIKGSAGYVALEKVVGALHGRQGSFVLQHSSTMARGVPQQSISVVPDSGTEALEGLSGKLVISIIEGKHFYAFEYDLSD